MHNIQLPSLSLSLCRPLCVFLAGVRIDGRLPFLLLPRVWVFGALPFLFFLKHARLLRRLFRRNPVVGGGWQALAG